MEKPYFGKPKENLNWAGLAKRTNQTRKCPMSLTELFCNVDDFCKNFEPALKQHLLTFDLKQPPKTKLSMSEIMTIVIHFHQSGYRCFKHYYQRHVQGYLAPFFPNLVSYNRFIELMPSALVGICPYLKTRMGKPTGISYVDSTCSAGNKSRWRQR